MRIWWTRLGVLFLIFVLLRVLFLYLNISALNQLDSNEIILALLWGLRFDLCIIATINAPLMMMHWARQWIDHSGYRKAYDDTIGILFLLANLPLIIIGTADTKMFEFTGRRTTLEFFAIATDITQQGAAIMGQFWWLTVCGSVFCISLIWASWQTGHEPSPKNNRPGWQRVIVATLLIGLGIIATRGGLQRKPLAPAHAYTWQPPVLANLVLNSGMTLLKSPHLDKSIRYRDFSGTQELRKILTPDKGAGPERIPLAPGRNVIVIIVESLATEYVGSLNKGRGYTPFIDSLMEKSVTFSESFASGRRSIDAMPSIFAGIPAWREEPYVTSPFNGNDIQALPRILKTQGYETFFFHSAANGSMHFDVFSAMAGINHYIGLSQYPDSGDRDGTWGIYDEPFLNFSEETLNLSKKPFFAGIFTLSSHNPFSVPAKYQGKFPKGTLPIHESIGYADFCLRQFFDKIRTRDWYQNTLFVITGDHTSLTENPYYGNPLGRFRVPIIFFDPSERLPMVGRNKIALHADITPTLLDLLGLTPSNPSLAGWSLFDPAYTGRFIQYEYGKWYFYDRETSLRLDDGDAAEAFETGDLTYISPRPIGSREKSKLEILKATRQYYVNGLLDNSWHH